ncbi:PREDICTED: zinc-binding protein A33-like [Cyprinodon variegatus]|uniref:Tripartite motif containing 35-28 n=1 Tax=Cyprinodon variegatus TaxID=28743 RepID=A0A3Q2CLH6_CYPVA|nr:PREDICTED: zinc-binding protein A33-like [Cyprinodon variegatus]
MDEDMPESTLPLRQDLTCPVCQGIFRDPVLLPCSHSFCRECQQKSWQFSHTCPICRVPYEENYAISNRALNDASESFLRQANLRPVQNQTSAEVCNLHLKPLELYCEKDEEPVCVDCVSQHSTHRLWSVRDGISMCKKELGFKVQIFEKKVETYKKMTKKFSNTVEYIKHQAGEAEKRIKAEFERLHKVLVQEEAKRLEALSNEEQKKLEIMQRAIDMAEEDIVKMKELIETVKKEMGNEDLLLLKNFQSVKRKAQWDQSDLGFPYDSLIDMGKHVGSLGYNIWKDMKDHIKYYPVAFDPNTASPWLSLSADLTSVKESPERLTVPDNRERFEPIVFVLGAQNFESGKHKWDIIVGDNPKWILGVSKVEVARKKKFTVSPNRGVWALGLSKGVYTVHDEKRTELVVPQSPEKIRIKLNMDKGEVSFWDGGREKHLVTLKYEFKGALCPIFGPGLHSTPMLLAPGKIAVHTS